jgi:type VI secretion system protein ImpH
MVVAFIGLIGPNGVLPRHYTDLVMRRLQEKDRTLREFFDLFHHRTISLFYRAWEKYRFPFAFERRERSTGTKSEDLFSQVLRCFVGLGTGELANRQEIPDDAYLYYSGLFAQTHRSADALAAVLRDYFQMPVTVEQFQGQWLYLDDRDLSTMPSRRQREGVNAVLGVSLVAGRRIWDAQSKFRIRVGPLKLAEFRRFFPARPGFAGGDILRPFCQLIRMYVGIEYDFDIQPILEASEIPAFRLDSKSDAGPRLGWTTWSRARAAERNAEEVCFFLDDDKMAR